MQAFDQVSGIALPMDRENVDTDAIVPQRWLVTVERDGSGRRFVRQLALRRAGR